MTSEELLVANAALNGEVQRSREALKIALLTLEKLRDEVAYLRRMRFGRSSEQLAHAQLELVGGQLAQPAVPSEMPGEYAADGEHPSNVTSLDQVRKKRKAQERTGMPSWCPASTTLSDRSR